MAGTNGERIKAKREELNLTQSQVAEKLFVTQKTAAHLENKCLYMANSQSLLSLQR